MPVQAFSFLSVFFLTLFSVTYIVYQLLPDKHQLQALRRTADSMAARGEKPAIFNIFRMPLAILLPFAAGKGSERYRKRKKEHLERAGLEQSLMVDEIIAMKIWLAVVLFLAVLVYPIPMIFKLFIGLFGFVFPDLWLYDRAKARRIQIIKQLPFTLDLLVLLVEAGLDFTAAIAQTVEKMTPGPLRDEFDRLLKDSRLGASRVEALKSMADRVRLKEITTLTTALIQASELGSSIGRTLRQQSEIMRAYRFQEAERQGGAASQKMLVPMVLFILPAVFIIILGPSVVRFLYGIY